MIKSKKKITLIIALMIMLSATFITTRQATTNTDIDFNNCLTQGKDIAYYIVSGNQYTASIP